MQKLLGVFLLTLPERYQVLGLSAHDPVCFLFASLTELFKSSVFNILSKCNLRNVLSSLKIEFFTSSLFNEVYNLHLCLPAKIGILKSS